MQLSSIDFINKRAQLHSDTVTNGFSIVKAHFEIKKFVQSKLAGGVRYDSVPTQAVGNIKKRDGFYTPRYGYVLSGWRWLPYGDVSHRLYLSEEIISEDQLTDEQVFDLSALPAGISVSVHPAYDKVEIREVYIGGGMTAENITQLAEQTAELTRQRIFLTPGFPE